MIINAEYKEDQIGLQPLDTLLSLIIEATLRSFLNQNHYHAVSGIMAMCGLGDKLLADEFAPMAPALFNSKFPTIC